MNKKHRSGIVYSTNPDHIYSSGEEPVNPTAQTQDLRIWLERRGGGKMATIVKGFSGKTEDLEKLGKLLKSKCSTGGSVKDNEIILQGDMREKVIALLLKEGIKARKAGG